VVDGLGLCGGGDGVQLNAEAGHFLPVGGDFAIQAGAERFFAAESIGSLGREALSRIEGGLGLGDFRGQGANGLCQAGALQFHSLQLYEIFNVLLHPSQVYGIYRALRKWTGGWSGEGADLGRSLSPFGLRSVAGMGRGIILSRGGRKRARTVDST